MTVKVRRKKTRSQKRVPFKAEARASVIDLFCGAGGLSYGFKKAGFDVVAGFDIDDNCRYAYEQNNEAPFVQCDVSELSPKELNSLFNPKFKRVVVGCAPCQPFSMYNQKNNDPKWSLVGRFADLISSVRPDVVSMENVPRLVDFKNGEVFQYFLETLRKVGYKIDWDILYGPDYGLGQTRSRLVLVASLLGSIKLPAPTHKGNHVTVADVIRELPKLNAGESHPDDPLHKSASLSTLNLARIKASKPGGSWRDWPENLVADCHSHDSGRSYSSVYGRMSWSKPSPTITTQFYGFGNGRFGHPEQNRALSLREGALLQGFPTQYKLVSSGENINTKQVGKLIGNAVPVTLALAIARSIKSHISDFS